MRIISFDDDLTQIARPVVSAGTFDGVHAGHQDILNRLTTLAAETGGESVIVTFEPHPRIALGKDADKLRLLNTPEEKTFLLEKRGIQNLIIHPFTTEFSMVSEQDFIRNFIVGKLHAATLVIGYNHRFGHNRQGSYLSAEKLAGDYGFVVEEMPQRDVLEQSVSSTRIRAAVASGDMAVANSMLGYEYFMSGKVVRGAGRGTHIGYPTANLQIRHPFKLIPARGVYAVRVNIEKRTCNGMCNIGVKPTFKGNAETVEVNVFDFDGDLYEKDLRIAFAERLRDEREFGNAAELAAQLKNDKNKALQILQRE